jgi:broad specificity polyphosphatase/5'/3'-nucleotidase SurE
MDQFEILQKELERRDFVMQQSLNKIDEHLGRLNGKVAEHEKILNINIPHTIDKCPQDRKINDIHDEVVKLTAVKEEDHNKHTRQWQSIGVNNVKHLCRDTG